MPGTTFLGVDAGATLAKIVVRTSDGQTGYELLPAVAVSEIAESVASHDPTRVGLTGGGGASLLALLTTRSIDALQVNEFAAWGSGASALLAQQAATGQEPYLLVSVGTGTSVMLADGMAVNRIGGTALGGGTVVGLGAMLLDAAGFTEIAELASVGDRRRVDLLVSDIYRPGEFPLTGDLTAASFGKLARSTDGATETGAARPEDLAHAIMGLVGENVALICAGLGAARQVRRVVFGGTTLRDNPALRAVLELITCALGHEVIFLERGEFAGAVGALQLAAGETP